MKAMRILSAIVLVFAFMLAGCGDKEAPAATTAETVPTLAAGQSLELTACSLTASTWSSPNGATIHLNAVPNGYAEGQSAAFVVRLEGEDAANVACDWNGSAYTASADLNAVDGYSYYVVLTAADGTRTEIPVNTPDNPVDEAMMNMETALNSYCSMTVEDSKQEGSKLTITAGTVEVQAPRITDEGETITCSEAVLVLTFNEEEVARVELTLEEAEIPGSYTADIAGTSFDIPAMEDDQQLAVRLDVTLSNGQFLTAPGGTWTFLDGQMMTTVG